MGYPLQELENKNENSKRKLPSFEAQFLNGVVGD